MSRKRKADLALHNPLFVRDFTLLIQLKGWRAHGLMPWRRVRVSGGIRLGALADTVLLPAMGWANSHLYRFCELRNGVPEEKARVLSRAARNAVSPTCARFGGSANCSLHATHARCLMPNCAPRRCSNGTGLRRWWLQQATRCSLSMISARAGRTRCWLRRWRPRRTAPRGRSCWRRRRVPGREQRHLRL